MCLPRPAARGRGGESRGGRSGLFSSLPCLPPALRIRQTCARLQYTSYTRTTLFSTKPFLLGGHSKRLLRYLSQGLRATFSLRPFSNGGAQSEVNDPAARGSTGCTLTSDKSQAKHLSQQA